MAQAQIHGSTQIQSGTVTSAQVNSTIIVAAGTNPFTGAQSLGGFQINSLGTPSLSTDAATKGYVDSVVEGISAKYSAVAGTDTETLTIASGSVTEITGTTVNGQSPNVGDYILILNAPSATGAAGGTTLSSEPANGLYCADSETKILTRRGFLSYEEVCEGDDALTLNVDTGLAEWQSVQSVHTFETTNVEMLSMEGESHSSLTTMNHRWPVSRVMYDYVRGSGRKHPKRTSRRETCIRQSHELNARDSIICSAPCSNLPTIAKYEDSLVELVAWFITEGTIRKNKGGSLSTGVRISQSHVHNEPYVSRIRSALTSLFGPSENRERSGRPVDSEVGKPRWREDVRSTHPDVTLFSLSVAAGEVLCEIAPNRIPRYEFLSSLTQSQLNMFIETCINADGHVSKRSGQKTFAQSGDLRHDTLQFACALAGVSTGKRISTPIDNHYSVTLRSTHRSQPHLSEQSAKKLYTGVVWCPKTGNGTWFAQRNGTGYFTGNTVSANTTNLTVARATDMSGSTNPAGAYVFVAGGAAWGGGGFVVTTPDTSASFTYGTGNVAFTQFSGAGEITTDSTLVKSGNQLSRSAITGNVTIAAGSNSAVIPASTVSMAMIAATGTPSSTTYLRGDGTWSAVSAAGGGTVTSLSVVSANGFAGTVATATSTPAITLTTSITGLLKGNGTAISAAVAGTDYLAPANLSTREKPGGTINGSNTAFTLANVPISGTESLYQNGLLLESGTGNDYTISTSTGAITMTSAPLSGDSLYCTYWF